MDLMDLFNFVYPYLPYIGLIVLFVVLPVLAVWFLLSLAKYIKRERSFSFKQRQQPKYVSEPPYKLKGNLLTKREYAFFQTLKPITDMRGYFIAVKPRMADFIYVTYNEFHNRKNFYRFFNKISSKHVDFLICDISTSKPIVAFELDDITHKRPDRSMRDSFVDYVYNMIGLKVHHIYEYDSILINSLFDDLVTIT